MSAQWVTISLAVPLQDIDFSDCGDGCGTFYGIGNAKYKGATIARFDDGDFIRAHKGMMDALGETPSKMLDRFAQIAAEEQENRLNDPVARARSNW